MADWYIIAAHRIAPQRDQILEKNVRCAVGPTAIMRSSLNPSNRLKYLSGVEIRDFGFRGAAGVTENELVNDLFVELSPDPYLEGCFYSCENHQKGK